MGFISSVFLHIQVVEFPLVVQSLSMVNLLNVTKVDIPYLTQIDRFNILDFLHHPI